MKKTTVLIMVILLLVALVSGAFVLYDILGNNYGTSGVTQPQGGGSMAPDFSVVDQNGNAVKLSDFRGTPVVLNFWATWCGPCKNELPDFDAMYLQLKGNVAFLMVNLTDGYQETIDAVKNFVAQNGYTFPVYFDINSEASVAYGVNAIPCTYFIASDGTISSQCIGMIDAASLRAGIDGIYAGNIGNAASGTKPMGNTTLIAAVIAGLSFLGACVTAVTGLLASRRRPTQPAVTYTAANRSPGGRPTNYRPDVRGGSANSAPRGGSRSHTASSGSAGRTPPSSNHRTPPRRGS